MFIPSVLFGNNNPNPAKVISDLQLLCKYLNILSIFHGINPKINLALQRNIYLDKLELPESENWKQGGGVGEKQTRCELLKKTNICK